MTNRFATAFGLLILAATSGCGVPPTAPLLPSSVEQNPAPSASTLKVFTDASGFSTSDLRDAQDQIVQFNSANEFIWAADDTRLQGFKVQTYPVTFGNGPIYMISIPGTTCSQGCAFEVRFGTKDGERRAYLTVDYIHDNPGTLVDVELVNGALVVTQTNEFPPGAPTLFGMLTELTPNGPRPAPGVNVYRAVTTGWLSARTDKDGFYRIPGLIDGTDWVEVIEDGYVKHQEKVTTRGDTRLDIQLVRQSR